MGVYLPNLEMPENCFECPWRCKVDPENLLCRISGEYFEETFSGAIQNRHKSCPLVPVPEHGDLIDRSKLYEKTAEWEAQALHMVETTMNDEDASEWRKWSTVLTERSAFKFDVADAPTIIPAEEGE